MSTLHGVFPEAQVVERLADGGIRVANRFYEITYDPKAGGAVAGVILKRLGRLNVMAAPGTFELGLHGGPALKAGPCKKVRIEDGQDPVLEFTAPLCDDPGKPSGGFLITRYEHRWGYVRIRQTLDIPRSGWDVQWVLLQNWAVNSELSSYGVRPGIGAETSCLPGAFGGIQWGRFSAGRAFDTLYTSRFVPRYVAFLDPGRAGIEWFVGSQLAQWDYQLVNEPGHGSLCLAPAAPANAIRFRVCPLDLAMGWKRLSGRYGFDSYIGVPILSGRAQLPFLDQGFSRKSWLTTEKIAGLARQGLTTLRFHHDGDSYGDGLFWRDGKYPPFEPADMREYDRVIRDCHRHGIKVTTYFSNKELHPSLPAFKQFGKQWARLPTDRRELLHNRYGGDEFGAQMCLRSGWLNYLKTYIDTVLKNHALDGTYFDWNAALYCHNPLHEGLKPDRPGFGGLAQSAAGHWDVDELLDLMEWTRRRVGPDGLMLVHNSTTPLAAAENFADAVVTLEWGYTHLRTGVPTPAELPPEWNFMGARSRGVIGYGSIAPDAAPVLRRQFRALALLTGVAPWTVTPEDLAAFQPLQGLDFGRYRFWDCRQSGVTADQPECGCAVYAGREGLILVAGNYGGIARRVNFDFNPKRYGARIGSPALRQGECLMSVAGRKTGMLRLTVRLPAGATRILKF
jgi:hypothetical protein